MKKIRNFSYCDERITYLVNPNNEFHYSEQFDVEKIFGIIGLTSHLIGNDITPPENNPEINISEVMWDIDLNSMEYTLQFRYHLHLEYFVEVYNMLSPKNNFKIDDDCENVDFKYSLILEPIDSPRNSG